MSLYDFETIGHVVHVVLEKIFEDFPQTFTKELIKKKSLEHDHLNKLGQDPPKVHVYPHQV